MGDYAINSQVEEYCVLMLWGSYLREGRGLGSVLVYLTGPVKIYAQIYLQAPAE